METEEAVVTGRTRQENRAPHPLPRFPNTTTVVTHLHQIPSHGDPFPFSFAFFNPTSPIKQRRRKAKKKKNLNRSSTVVTIYSSPALPPLLRTDDTRTFLAFGGGLNLKRKICIILSLSRSQRRCQVGVPSPFRRPLLRAKPSLALRIENDEIASPCPLSLAFHASQPWRGLNSKPGCYFPLFLNTDKINFKKRVYKHIRFDDSDLI